MSGAQVRTAMTMTMKTVTMTMTGLGTYGQSCRGCPKRCLGETTEIDETEDDDANPTNEIQILSFDTNTNQLSISGANSVTIPTGGTDADADPTNEIQTISKSGNTVLK